MVGREGYRATVSTLIDILNSNHRLQYRGFFVNRKVWDDLLSHSNSDITPTTTTRIRTSVRRPHVIRIFSRTNLANTQFKPAAAMTTSHQHRNQEQQRETLTVLAEFYAEFGG